MENNNIKEENSKPEIHSNSGTGALSSIIFLIIVIIGMIVLAHFKGN